MGKPKAPPAPDYRGAAIEEGEQSRDTALFNTNLNRPDQITPQGSTTWTLRPGADPRNPQPGDYIQTVSYSPEQQALYDSGTQISQSFLDTANRGLNNVDRVLGTPMDTSGAPALGTMQDSNLPNSTINTQGMQNVNAIGGDARVRLEEAMYSRLRPEMERQQSSLNNELLNSGLERGSEAWYREQDRLSRERNDARMQVQAAGGAEESRLAALQMALRGQQFGERSSVAGFENSAAGQNFMQDLQRLGFNNQARGQSLQESAWLRSLPLNEINALRTGSQVQAPQFSNYYTGGNAQAPQLLAATGMQGNYDMNAYQQEMAGYNALLGGLANMGGAALGAPGFW